MPTTILSRMFGVTLDKKLVLNNSQWAATLDIGTTWNEIWLGWRWVVQDSGSNILSVNRYFGVMSSPASGMTNGPLTNSVSHWFGGYFSNTMLRSTSPTRYAFGLSAGKKVGSTITDGSDFASYMLSADPANVRTAGIMRIAKGSPNFAVQCVSVTGTAGLVNIELSAVETAMQAATISDAATSLNTSIGGAGTRYVASAAVNIPVDEATDGFFNAVTVGWSSTTNSLELSEILFARRS